VLDDEWRLDPIPTSDLMDIHDLLDAMVSSTVELEIYIKAARRIVPRNHGRRKPVRPRR
jgi:hypothetical protein